ncbi:hypothetical protein Tco_1123994 [Tanacetum coccineum]|uniref:Transposase (Putative), gypsy type n=1 Tax=Tanacetum coccineum TaxID=301880 RepID=A0ABQ5J578_9ASTR
MDTTGASGSSRTPSTVEKSPLDFADKDLPPPNTGGVGTEERVQDELSREIPLVGHASTAEVISETGVEEEVAIMGPPVNKRRKQMRRKRANDEAEANAPPKVLRKDHVSSTAYSTYGGKSLAAMGLGTGSISSTPSVQGAPTAAKNVSDPDPLSSYMSHHVDADLPGERLPRSPPNMLLPRRLTSSYPWGVQSQGDRPLFPSWSGHRGPIYMNLARQVAMGSQLRLRFEQEVRLLKKARAKIARRDQRIQVREEEIKKLDQKVKSLRATETEVHGLRNQTKNLETLLGAKADMKKAAEAKNITGEEEKKAAFEQFKKYEDDRVEQRCAEMDARLDMLAAIVGHRWVIGHGLHLAVIKCAESTELRQVFANVISAGIAKGMSEGLKYGIKHGKADRDLVDVKAYDPEANDKLVKALQDLKDMEYPMVDQLERLKDAPMELIMTSLHLQGDTGEDAPQRIRDLRPSSSQLKIPMYPEVRNPKDRWAIKEKMLLEDAIAANISRAEKKKKCRVVYRTHGIGSAHHARSGGCRHSD